MTYSLIRWGSTLPCTSAGIADSWWYRPIGKCHGCGAREASASCGLRYSLTGPYESAMPQSGLNDWPDRLDLK